jgi:hypothetical protein
MVSSYSCTSATNLVSQVVAVVFPKGLHNNSCLGVAYSCSSHGYVFSEVDTHSATMQPTVSIALGQLTIFRRT